MPMSMISEMVDFIKINSDSSPCSESCSCATVTADSVQMRAYYVGVTDLV